MTAYRSLADVYEFFTPEALLTPEGNVEALAPWLPERGRVLDCACGIGLLAAGLAQRGFDVQASDASPEMVRRTRARGVDARVCTWEELPPTADFDVVVCVGNSLPHARDRVAALRGMAGTLRAGGTLVLTSRNWEREQPSESYEVERGGRHAVVSYEWADGVAEITVRVEGRVVRERLRFWPFTHDTLLAELREVGLEPAESTFEPGVDRYLVTART